jgi:membrane-associated phospholipid phosphatase
VEELLQRVNSSKKLKKLLKVISLAVTVLSVFSFAFTVACAFYISAVRAVKILVMAGIPFILVSLSRFIVNAKRPYEVYEFYTEPPKNKKGRSFPSRHVFSSFLISTLLITVNIPLASVFYILSLALAVCRVLLGIHFSRDVIVGALLGILSGVIALILL